MKSNDNLIKEEPFYNQLTIISELDNFPTAINKVITLPSRTSWLLTGDIDLQGNRIVCQGNVSIQGLSSETCSLFSTGLSSGSNLITTAFTLPMNDITLGCPSNCSVFSLDSDSSNGLDLVKVNFGSTTLSCGSIGTIKDYSNVVFNECAFLNFSGSLKLDGSIGTVAFSDCFFISTGLTNGTIIQLEANVDITRRFRIVNSSLVIHTGNTGIKLIDGFTLLDEGFILDNVNFSGTGTPLNGIDYTSIKSLISNCIGVRNSFLFGLLTLQGNTSETTIATAGTNTLINGTYETDTDNLGNFTFLSSGKLTYNGARNLSVLVSMNASISGSSNKDGHITIALNGTAIALSQMKFRTGGSGAFSHCSSSCVVNITKDDTIEGFIRNDTDTSNFTVEDLVMTITGIN